MNAKEDIIGHQVNCKGVMGSGVAFQIKMKFHKAYEEYLKKVAEAKSVEELLGSVQFVDSGDKIIANMFGQPNYGRRDNQYTSIEALKNCLMILRLHAESKGLSVALPYMIGCGLGNADWRIVESLIKKAFEGYSVTLYKLY